MTRRRAAIHEAGQGCGIHALVFKGQMSCLIIDMLNKGRQTVLCI